jgi:hypothetical protein
MFMRGRVHPNEHYWFYAGKHEKKREKNRENMLGKKREKKRKKHDKTWVKKGRSEIEKEGVEQEKTPRIRTDIKNDRSRQTEKQSLRPLKMCCSSPALVPLPSALRVPSGEICLSPSLSDQYSRRS